MPIVRSHEEWQQLLVEQAASHQTIRQFCHDKGIGRSTFSTWKRRLLGTPPVHPSRAFIPITVTPTITADITLTMGSAIMTLPTTVSPIWVAELLSRLGG